jgi:hypothetical protein
MLQVIGVSPVAVSVWLYAVSTTPLGNDVVVIVGATPLPVFPPPGSPQPAKASAKITANKPHKSALFIFIENLLYFKY